MSLHIALFSDRRAWHEQALERAFARHGARLSLVSLRTCRITPDGLWIPGFDAGLPDAAFVRAIPAGSFEQVTLRLDILHVLQEWGVLVYNPARAIERTVDKAMTTLLLQRAGIPTPASWVAESRSEAQAVLRRETSAGRKVVMKPLFGSRGRGLQLLTAGDGLPTDEDCAGVYYLQSYVAADGAVARDWRVLVIGASARAAMERHNTHWITNRSCGGECRATSLDSELAALAEAAARAVDTYYAGVDIIRDRNGDYQVLEVNGIPAWRGLQSVNELDIAAALSEDLLSCLSRNPLQAVS